MAADELQPISVAYDRCADELRANYHFDDGFVSPLKTAGYPQLEDLIAQPAAILEAVNVYLRDELLAAFLPFQASAAQFMVNSIEEISEFHGMIVMGGRGYHDRPGFAAEK